MVDASGLRIEQLWTAAEVAEFLKVSKAWVYSAARKGDLPSLRLSGQTIRFLPDVIRAWVKTQGEPPPGGASVIKLRGDR